MGNTVVEVVALNRRRIHFFSFCILIMVIIFIGRLMQLQLFETENFSKRNINLLEASVKQRTQQITIDDGRGMLLDSDGIPLSHEEKIVVILFPFLKNNEWDSKEVARILNISEDVLIKEIEELEKPIIFAEATEVQGNAIRALQNPGIIAIKGKWSNSSPIASQFLGIVNEDKEEMKKRYPDRYSSLHKIGVTGLQRQFDPFLQSQNPSKLIFHVDAIGNPLFGIDVKYTGETNPYYPLNVLTTINRTIQEKLEALLNEHQIEQGGALILEIDTGNIVAIASRPHLNWEDPFKDDGTKNMLFEQHIPGSVFKTVVAAAFIQEGLESRKDTYNCDLDIRGQKANRLLGELTLEESFSRSCNRTFAEIANQLQALDENILEHYAEQIGVLGSLSWEGDVFHLADLKHLHHSPGRLFLDPIHKKDQHILSQVGIGQHEVRLTPLGVANMMATIARGGEVVSVRAATEIQYANGGTMFTFPKQVKDKSISTRTAQRLQQLLRSVVTDPEGTGAFFQNLPYDVAGKSGTAETGIFQDDKQLYHKWFAGYFPFQRPKYALVTVNLHVHEFEGSVYGLFADIVKMIHEFEQNSIHHIQSQKTLP